MSLATTEGSRKTMPLPLTCTSTLAVPRSMPISKLELQSTVVIESDDVIRPRNSRADIRCVSKNPGRFDERRDAAAALHLAAELGEQFFQSLVAAVDIFQTDDLGFARGGKPGDHERRAGANVGRFDRCAGKLRWRL